MLRGSLAEVSKSTIGQRGSAPAPSKRSSLARGSGWRGQLLPDG
jgi:hypothetical protein